MKTIILPGILLFFCTISHAQMETANWHFGSNVGLTFTTNPPSLTPGSALHTYEGSSSASDSLGNLLFYTDGVTVWNKLHNVMPNGTGLLGHSSSSQSALVLPMPGSSSIYFIITAPEINTNDPLSYSIVDMLSSGGLGSVVLKNSPLLASSTEKVSAVRHQNGIDIWIVAHEFGNADFHAYLLSSAGINPVSIVSSVGNPITDPEHKIGIIKIAPCGSFLAMTNHSVPGISNSTLELFDFNNATGQVSNARLIGNWLNSTYGIEFSPDNLKLYMAFTNPGNVVQYDISSGIAANIIASADTIGQSSAFLAALQLAPDGKIYIAKYTVQSLDCITNPNLAGNGSAYVNNAVSLTDSCFLGLPGFLTSWFCDISSGVHQADVPGVDIFPNPFNDELTISSLSMEVLSVSIYDLCGHLILRNQEIGGDQLQIPTCSFATGLYLLEIKTDHSTSMSRIVKQDF